MIYIVFFLSTLIFLFTLYVLAKNDFVILRQNIPISGVFDKIFIAGIFIFLLSRIFFIIESGNFGFFNIFKFLYFFRYPGFSVLGAFLALVFLIPLLFRGKKNTLRILDIFLLSFFSFSLITLVTLIHYNLLVTVILFIVSIMYFLSLLRVHKDFLAKDGSVTLLILMYIALQTIILEYFVHKKTLMLNLAQWEGVAIFFICFIVFFSYQKIAERKKRTR